MPSSKVVYFFSSYQSTPSNHTSMDAATTRTIRIGSANIGLVGLDIALNQAAAQKMAEDEAVEFLMQAVREKNYIPVGSEHAAKYREALRTAYRHHVTAEEHPQDELVVRIFGSGCVSCNGLQSLLIEVLNRMHIAADIEQIHDPDEIGRMGVTQTPALMINGTVKSSGRLPSPAMVEHWIREIIPN